MPKMTLKQAFETFEKYYGVWSSNPAYHYTALSTLTYPRNKYQLNRFDTDSIEKFIISLDRAFSNNDVRGAFYKLAEKRGVYHYMPSLAKKKLSKEEVDILRDTAEKQIPCLPCSRPKYSKGAGTQIVEILSAPEADGEFFNKQLHWPEGMFSFYKACATILAHFINEFEYF